MGNAESASQSAHESVPDATSTDAPDEPWWQQIEHENLILQQVQEQQLQPVQAMDTSPKTEPTDATATAAAEEVKPEGDGSTLEEFREQLASKRLARQTAVQEMREELTKLREQLAQEKAENQRLRRQVPSEQLEVAAGATLVAQESQPDPDDENPSSRSRHANIELANAQLALQLANADNLSLRSELDVVQRQVGTLKEVICCCKQMLSVKEEQCAQVRAVACLEDYRSELTLGFFCSPPVEDEAAGDRELVQRARNEDHVQQLAPGIRTAAGQHTPAEAIVRGAPTCGRR